MVDISEILKKYGKKLEEEGVKGDIDVQSFSKEYGRFKADMMPKLSRYEKLCNGIGNLVKIKLSEKDSEKIQRSLDTAHLDINSSQVVGLAIAVFVLAFFASALLSVGIFFISGSFPLLFLVLGIFSSMFLFYYSYSTPTRLANIWRLKASSQMVPAILYAVVYMKHTSNLERAIAFAAEHLDVPLALDFRKVFWDVETGKYSSIKESLDHYLEFWRDSNVEFIESFHLVESSLYEPDEARRIVVLERALQVILDGVYDKMLKYTHSIRGPLTNLYMLGIILPTLGLALLPLASTLLQGAIKWYHVFLLFNLIIPLFVFYLTSQIMLKRPGGYGETELLELNPRYKDFRSKKPYLIAGLVVLPLILLGLLPFIFQYTPFPNWMGLQRDYTFSQIGLGVFGDTNIFDFKTINSGVVGPFGPMALMLSLLIPFGIAMFFSMAYKMKTRELIKARNSSKHLEEEFASSLFQLGNRIGDGLPAEIAFARVAESTKGQETESFFRIVNSNIQQAGMGLDDAIFNKRRGAIIYFPSSLISISMRILVESVKKGLQVAARSLISISEYVKNIKKINERLGDLLAEIVSDMKSNMAFLAPLLAGIIVGLTGMITTILAKLTGLFALGGDQTIAGVGSLGSIVQIFDLTAMIPPYFLQLSIGLYLIEIVFILTSTLVTVDSGEDRLRAANETGKNLKVSLILYSIVAFISIVALAALAAIALGGITGG